MNYLTRLVAAAAVARSGLLGLLLTATRGREEVPYDPLDPRLLNCEPFTIDTGLAPDLAGEPDFVAPSLRNAGFGGSGSGRGPVDPDPVVGRLICPMVLLRDDRLGGLTPVMNSWLIASIGFMHD